VAGLLLRALHGAYAASLAPAWLRFQRAAHRPQQVSRARLRDLLLANRDTAYGRAHGFGQVDSVEAWRRRVPVVDYDALEPWVQRVARGEANVLTAARVRMLEKSGGSTATNKLIPYTDALLHEFADATGPWLYDLYRHLPGLHRTRAYWSVSPAARTPEITPGGLPVGFKDDTEYFGPLARLALRRMLAVPPGVARIADMDAWRRATALGLLAAEDLGLVSVWSPTFLLALMAWMQEQLEDLLPLLSPERRASIQAGLDRTGAFTGEALWPHLTLLSCWADGVSAEFVPALRRVFPLTALQPKGLLATEGVVSFPLWEQEGSVAAVASHYLEFRDLDAAPGAVLEAHELAPGGSYSPILTTGGGLYRYHLKDVVRCVGRYRALPLLRFEGRLDRVSDLVGEKINARQVDHALDLARTDAGLTWRFALLAPALPPAYVLYLESDSPEAVVARARDVIEAYLATGHHYAYARSLQQLGPLRVQRLRGGWAAYEQACRERGQKAGDVKPTHLETRPLRISEPCQS
jgi:hypothetical protein